MFFFQNKELKMFYRQGIITFSKKVIPEVSSKVPHTFSEKYSFWHKLFVRSFLCRAAWTGHYHCLSKKTRNLFVGFMHQTHLRSYGHFIALSKNYGKNPLTWSFLFCTKASFNEILKHSRIDTSKASNQYLSKKELFSS